MYGMIKTATIFK